MIFLWRIILMKKVGMIPDVDNKKKKANGFVRMLVASGQFGWFFWNNIRRAFRGKKSLNWSKHGNFTCWVHLMIKLYNRSMQPN